MTDATVANEAYEGRVDAYLAEIGVEFKAEFLGYGKHFADDTDSRDRYRATFKRERSEFSVDFGQSTAHSQPSPEFKQSWREVYHHTPEDLQKAMTLPSGSKHPLSRDLALVAKRLRVCVPDPKAPTAYDVLACIEKCAPPPTFEEWAEEMGMDPDSRKGERVFRAVVEEWLKVSRFFSAEELGRLQELAQ